MTAADMPPRIEMIQSWHLTYKTTQSNAATIADMDIESLYKHAIKGIEALRKIIRSDVQLARELYSGVIDVVGEEMVLKVLGSRHNRIMHDGRKAKDMHSLFLIAVEDMYHDLVMIAEDDDDDQAMIAWAMHIERTESIQYTDPRATLAKLMSE